MQKANKYISITILLLLAVSVIFSPLVGGVGTAHASTTIKFDQTYVLDDLQNSRIDGVTFSPNNYGYSQEKEPRILSFVEYGYNYDSTKQGNYGLYLYVYNPCGKQIQNKLNTVSIATVYSNGKAVDYEKFTITLLSVSTDKYANLFYKFKVADASKILTRVSVSTSARRYDVAEIELNYGEQTSEAYTVGNYYEYSGFSKGYGADPNADSTLTCMSNMVETLPLKVQSTYYRYNNSVYFQSNLSSVYFGVPNETLNKYGKLQQIKANWFETKTSNQFVMTNVSHYDRLSPFVGVQLKAYNDTIGYEYFAPSQDFRLINYNPKYYWDTYNPLPQIDWLFSSDNGTVSTDEVLSYAKNYTSRFGGDLLIDKYSKALFVEEVDENRQYGWQGDDGKGLVIDADSLVNINGFDTGSNLANWWLSLFYSDLQSEDIKDKEPIYIVKDTDIVGDNATIANRLLINENDVDDLKAAYRQNLLENKKTVLFRFALTDYRAYPLRARQGTLLSLPGDEVGYITQQTAFLDFDIIWLKFVKENVETVIPTVSKPIDVFSGLTKPLEPDFEFWGAGKDIWRIIKIILAVLAGIVLIVVVCWIVRIIVKPIKAIDKTVKATKKNNKK